MKMKSKQFDSLRLYNCHVNINFYNNSKLYADEKEQKKPELI